MPSNAERGVSFFDVIYGTLASFAFVGALVWVATSDLGNLLYLAVLATMLWWGWERRYRVQAFLSRGHGQWSPIGHGRPLTRYEECCFEAICQNYHQTADGPEASC